ncbi:hypothetical protein PGT21_009109 [Puccinia graminis f. sp. tritici]|uniref:Uncharacterized protein n=1 Tax=Puccinia graminis f. sp. tritici TaxID=56615 RepID=A0A5B0N3X5_PUCGR|nr:hypothetical protein PGT21_009109 [Puccinia graminis f. sp. tritici]
MATLSRPSPALEGRPMCAPGGGTQSIRPQGPSRIRVGIAHKASRLYATGTYFNSASLVAHPSCGVPDSSHPPPPIRLSRPAV